MDLEILPEPSDEERRAIVEALRLEDEQGQELTPWRLFALKTDEPRNEPDSP